MIARAPATHGLRPRRAARRAVAIAIDSQTSATKASQLSSNHDVCPSTPSRPSFAQARSAPSPSRFPIRGGLRRPRLPPRGESRGHVSNECHTRAMVAVLWSQVGGGLFCVVWGLGFAALGWRLSNNPQFLRKTSERRWNVLRFASGRRTKEEWIARDAQQQGRVAKWAIVPGGLLFAVLGLTTVVSGFGGHR